MKFPNEISSEIWKETGFQKDMAILEAMNTTLELFGSNSVSEPERIEPSILRRLLQAALVFSESDEQKYIESAQRISTASVRLNYSECQNIDHLFAIVQSRLRNFPALSAGGKKIVTPASAPLSIQLEFVNALKQQSITTGDGTDHIFSKFQLDAWQALSGGYSATLSGPTSAGKSYVLLLYLLECFRESRIATAVYLVPTKALINQVSSDALDEIEKRGVSGVTVTAIPVDITTPENSKTLYVLTQERLEALLINHQNITIDLVIVDEAQMLSDGSRGVLLESVIDRILQNNRQPQFVFSGPLIANPSYFSELFNIQELKDCSTKQSPVTQNIVMLNYSYTPDSKVEIVASNSNTTQLISTIPLDIRLTTDLDRISYLSYLFGRSGSSIVYAGGKADAEKIAMKISNEMPVRDNITNELSELITFVKKHVHKDYALVSTLEKGIAFHYGHMPSLLRKELEGYFKAKKISYLVCTSTLLYGLNLPARNLFLYKPTTGRGSSISGTDFWNLAGRAGRLGRELEGNVFLIDYDTWETSPLKQTKEVTISSALKHNIVDNSEKLIDFLSDHSIPSEKNRNEEITLGKLVLDHRQGTLDNTMFRYEQFGKKKTLNTIKTMIENISTQTQLPTDVLDKNIGVSIFRQVDLLNYFIKRLKQLDPSELVPAHPLIDFKEALNSYRRAFKRIHTYLLNYPSHDNRHNFFSALSLRWMRGDPLPALIDSAIRFHKTKGNKSIAAIIRETMEDVENDLRFRYVKFFTCYNSLLAVALKITNNEEYISSIPDIPLFLEMGGSSGSMINLMALGLSRSTAEAISEYITNKDMDVTEVKAWLESISTEHLDISPVCIREIDELLLKLIPHEA